MKNKIPKRIHYIWFGNGEKSELIKKCIASWKKYLKDWEFIEWNENNYDIKKCEYIKEAYQEKKYAFAADYARFDILYEYGGVYLDTDVELLKAIPEEFLKYNGFTGVESNNRIAPGLILAVEPHNKIILEIKKIYEKEHFFSIPNQKIKTVVDYTTEVFEKHGFVTDGTFQNIEGIQIYPVEYFCAYDFDIREFQTTPNTISIHHYTFSWGSKKRKFIGKVKNVIKKIIGTNNYKKLLYLKRKLKGTGK